jgi:hypothetical protein
VDLTPFVPQIITAVSTLTAAFGAILLNRRSTARDREVDYNRELCREMFLSFMRDAYIALDAVRDITGEGSHAKALEKLEKFRATYYESSGMSILVAPSVKINLTEAYKQVLIELQQRRRALAEMRASGNDRIDRPPLGPTEFETDRVLEAMGARMRDVLGLKNQQNFILRGK